MSLDHLPEKKDKQLAIAVWLIVFIIIAITFWTVVDGTARGLKVGEEPHPPEYLEASCIACFLVISVIPILRLTGIAKMPWWFSFLLIIDVMIYIESLCYGLYKDPDVPWWGFFGHVLSSMSVGGVVFLALCIIQKYQPKRLTLGSEAAIHCYTLMISLAWGGIWEIMEGYIDMVTGSSYMSYGVFDTLDDLRADLVGSVLMVVIAGIMLRNRTVLDIADSTQFKRPRKKSPKHGE
jgi:hypothetical protein